MLRKTLVLASAVILTALAVSSKAQAWGAYHVGYTHYGAYTGFHHYGYTRYRGGYGGDRYGYHYGGYGGYGGYHYGGYHYGYGYPYGGAHYGYYRAW